MGRHKRPRAERVAPQLTAEKAALIKGMLARRDRQSDVSAYFGINQGRIYEIASGQRFKSVVPAPLADLPERGPYVVVPQARHIRAAFAEDTLKKIMSVLERAQQEVAQVIGEEITGQSDAS